MGLSVLLFNRNNLNLVLGIAFYAFLGALATLMLLTLYEHDKSGSTSWTEEQKTEIQKLTKRYCLRAAIVMAVIYMLFHHSLLPESNPPLTPEEKRQIEQQR